MNPQACFADLKGVQTEIQSFLSGPITIETAMAEVEKLKPLLKTLLTDCTIGFEEEHLLQMVSLRDWVQCATDLAGLAPPIIKLVADSIKGNLDGIISDVTAIVQVVGKSLKDCFGSQAQYIN